MTSVLFGGGLNYQRNNPLGAEIRGLRTDVEDLRRLVEDIAYRLDKAGIPTLPEEVAAPAPVAAPVYNPNVNTAPAPAPASTGTGRRRG